MNVFWMDEGGFQIGEVFRFYYIHLNDRYML